MKERQSQETQDNKQSPWVKTQYSNLIRYVPSGVLFARFRICGKLIWKSLKTDRITVAKLRLADLEKQERQKAEAGQLLAKGKILFGDALKAYREKGFRPVVPRNRKDAKPLKAAAVAYYEQRIDALLKSWPSLNEAEIRKLTERECLSWSDRARKDMAPTVFNHTLGVLRSVIDFGIKIGARYDNPALAVMRESETPKPLELPPADKFEAFLAEIESGGSGWSKPCADLVRFMAFGGFRKTEAANVTWSDCDFGRHVITIRGDPKTGLKNRAPGEVRHVPMIPDMVRLLEDLRTERGKVQATDRVMLVQECQRAMDRAAKVVGMQRITHHDLRHLFATRCIESGVDIPAVSRWLGHRDGGALAMRVYGHLRDQHSAAMAQKVTFTKQAASNVVLMPKESAA